MTSQNEKKHEWGINMSGLLTLVLALNVQVANAGNPHKPVSSDGLIVQPVAAEQAVTGENGYRGTGRPSGVPLAESAARFASLVALPDPGDNGMESIIGVDSRVLVNPTTTYPARAVVLITFTGGRCTGWLYGPDIVATAGHCVHSGGAGGTWKQNVRVYPGRNGTLSPYGSCTSKRLHSVSGWTTSGSEVFDYGAIKLNCTIGNTTGWLGHWWQTASLTGLPTFINGYPSDKPLTQWRSSGFVNFTSTRQIFYQNDTVGGMSGSPVYQFRTSGSSFCTGYCVMAIHAYGLHATAPHSTHNHATRIVKAVSDNLLAWRNIKA
jgi:glutamyl endopeptidase